MPTLRRTLKDATGQPLDPEQLYTPLSSFATKEAKVYNQNLDTLRGDHPAVSAAPWLWLRNDTPTEAKRAVYRAHVTARLADVPPPPEDPTVTRIVSPRYIPYGRRAIAVDGFSKGDVFVRRGSAHDVDDAIVRAAPEMFRDLDGRPVRIADDGPAAEQMAR